MRDFRLTFGGRQAADDPPSLKLWRAKPGGGDRSSERRRRRIGEHFAGVGIVADVPDGLRAKALSQLREVETLRSDGAIERIENAFGQSRGRIEWTRRGCG